jgi:protein MAK16
MQHDEMIWTVINNQFCSYKTSLKNATKHKRQFCRHPYSITGLCNRSHCPLANSLYATIKEDNGRVSLYIKTVERAHSPKNLWEKIDLSRNYSKALKQVEEHLQYFPKAMQHRNKQRLTKIHQYLIRMRKIKLKELSGKKARVVGINRKIDQREERREKKALIAAKIEGNIQKELLERLAKGTYGDIYNFPEVPYQKALEDVEDEEMEEESELEESEEEEENGMVEYVEDLEDDESLEGEMEDIEFESNSEEEEESDDDSEDDSGSDDDESGSESSEDEDGSPKAKPKKKPSDKTAKQDKRKRGTRVEIEYEEEEEEPMQQSIVAGSAW